MENKFSLSFNLPIVLLLVFLRPSVPTTVVLDDAITHRNVVSLFVEHSLVFIFKDFHSRRASEHCNLLAKATLLHTANSSISFKWHPTGPGNCEKDQSVMVRVVAGGLSSAPRSSPAPAPTLAGDVYRPHKLT